MVNGRWDLLETIVPFFQEHPLRTVKKFDFEKFVQVLEMIENGLHLTREGLAQIAEVTQTMNRRKSRRDLIGILRGHTPNIQGIG